MIVAIVVVVVWLTGFIFTARKIYHEKWDFSEGFITGILAAMWPLWWAIVFVGNRWAKRKEARADAEFLKMFRIRLK